MICFEMCILYNAEVMLKNAAKKQWFYVNSAQHCSRVLRLELVMANLGQVLKNYFLKQQNHCAVSIDLMRGGLLFNYPVEIFFSQTQRLEKTSLTKMKKHMCYKHVQGRQSVLKSGRSEQGRNFGVYIL